MERVLAGRYELEVPLGRGGSGEVWRGRDMATRRPVAIKLVELSQIDDPGLLAETIGRFRREATVVAGLRHPNIVTSLDAGRIGNQLFMIMELAPGVSLASMMDERGARGMGLFPVSSVLRIAEQASTGLAAAHAAGIVHRDIKPSNLMVTPQLGVEIIDFGIARLLEDNSPRLTMRGHAVGTIAYMSPEQAQGDEVDARSDLYSLGCVLYQLLSGRLPFRSPLPAALLMMQVMDQPDSLAVLRPDLPPELPDLVSQLMAKDRTARPADADQVISRLAAIAHTIRRDEPQHEADRQTYRPGDLPDAADETRMEPVLPALGRPSAATPERMAGRDGMSPPGPGQTVQGFSDLGSRDTAAAPPWEAREPAPLPLPPPVPPRPAPPTAGRGSDGVPAWPAERPRDRPRRRRWPGVLSTLLTLALAAGVWVYVYERSHAKLAVTKVGFVPGKTGICNGTTVIAAVIITNGHGGPISYEWITDPVTLAKPTVLVAEAPGSGSDEVRVSLDFTFHGKGTGQAKVTLRVLTPARSDTVISYPYSCAG
ncbi:MAG TPA: serine/threonine-protein kinase [Trebonia sp.]